MFLPILYSPFQVVVINDIKDVIYSSNMSFYLQHECDKRTQPPRPIIEDITQIDCFNEFKKEHGFLECLPEYKILDNINVYDIWNSEVDNVIKITIYVPWTTEIAEWIFVYNDDGTVKSIEYVSPPKYFDTSPINLRNSPYNWFFKDKE